MNESQIWLGRCQAVYTHQAEQPETQRYWVSAVVWCNNPENFERSVKSCMAERGLTLLHIETPLPKVEWLAQHHPESDSEIQNLIDHVERYYTTALGYLYAIPKGIEETGTVPYLHIETLSDIEPLDGQFDVHPPKTVPDKLYEPLFGQPEPTKQEIEQYGNQDQVPPMKLYAILDAAKVKVPGLRSLLDTSGLDFACLLTGQDYDELKDSAPYIVELKEDNDFTRTLFTYNPNFSDKHLSVHLWHKEPGIYIRSRASLVEVGQHFAQFVRIPDEQGKRYFFRFWEAMYLVELLRQIAIKPGKVAMLYRLPTAPIFQIICTMQSQVSIATLCADIQNIQPEPLLDEQTITYFKDIKWHTFKQRVLDTLLQDYSQQVEAQQPETIFAWCDQAKRAGYHIEMAIYRFVQACLLADSIKTDIAPLVAEVAKIPDLGEVQRAQKLLEQVETLIEK
jgi:hypothetical protein